MKNYFKILAAITVATVLSAGSLRAQCKGDYGSDRPTAEAKMALYGDDYNVRKYRQAIPPLQWLLTNAPKVSSNIYKHGVDIYDSLARAEKDPAKKQVYVDSIMLIFDLRIKNCGDEATVVNRKATSMFKFNYNKKEKLGEILAMFDKAYELQGNNMQDPSLEQYMKTVQLHSKFNKGSLTDDQIIEKYDRIMAIIDVKVKEYTTANNAKALKSLEGIRKKVDDHLADSPVEFTCAKVKQLLEPKFVANPTDKALAMKIFKFMLKDKCTDDPLWLQAGELIKDNEPKDFALIKNLAVKHLGNGNTQRAEELIKEALLVADAAKSAEQKSEALMYLGTIEIRKGNKVGARGFLLQAGAADKNNKEAFSKIGDLYYNSFDDCAKRQNKAEDRLVYIAAYEMYQRAGDGPAMAKARAQFPSVEEIFELNWKKGEPKKISCWVNETVTLQTRD
ncbi:MAG: tetratricopeptide repeat protein [Bacteroidota bacterium]